MQKKLLPACLIFCLGLALWQCGNEQANPSEKKEDTSAAIRQGSTDRRPEKNRDSTGAQRKRSKQIDSLTTQLEANPEDAHALAERSRLYIKQKNSKYAVADAEKAHRIDSNNARIQEVRGDAHYADNNTRRSRNAWRRCINIDAENIPCRMKLADLYLAVQEHKKSLELVDEVIALDSKHPKAFFNKGLLTLYMRQDTATALQYMQRAADLDQDYLEAWDMMGYLHAAQKNPLAVSYYKRALEIAPEKKADIHYKLGMFYLETEEWNEAIDAFHVCIEENPKDVESLFNLGYIHIELKVYRTALDYFTQAIEAKERNYKAYYGRGYAFEMMGDVQNAYRDYNKALGIRQDYEPAREGLGRVRQMMQ